MRLITGTLLLLCAGITTSHAQSNAESIEIFGTFDINLRRVNFGNSGSVNSISPNGLTTSKFGFRGEEDLGGGLKAGFWLENGFLTDTGAFSDSTRMFNRRSTVSLVSPSIGEIRVGRDYTPSYSALSASGPFGDTGLAAIGNIAGVVGSGARTFTRADNQVAYFLPKLVSGLTGTVSVAAGEGILGASYRGANLGYETGPVRLLAGFGRTRIDGSDFRHIVVTGSYDFEVVKLHSAFVSGAFRSNKQNTYQIAAGIPIGPGLLKLAYTIGDMRGPAISGAALADSDDVKRIAVGYTYNLSKRTSLYTTAVKLRNEGRSAFALATAPAGYRAGQSNSAFDFGLRHNF